MNDKIYDYNDILKLESDNIYFHDPEWEGGTIVFKKLPKKTIDLILNNKVRQLDPNNVFTLVQYCVSNENLGFFGDLVKTIIHDHVPEYAFIWSNQFGDIIYLERIPIDDKNKTLNALHKIANFLSNLVNEGIITEDEKNMTLDLIRKKIRFATHFGSFSFSS